MTGRMGLLAVPAYIKIKGKNGTWKDLSVFSELY